MARPQQLAARRTTAPISSRRRPPGPADRHALRHRHHRRHHRRQRPDRPRRQHCLGPAVPGALQLQPARPLHRSAPAFEPFVEAKWNRVNALGNNAGPSFIQGTFGQFDFRERVRLDNPFLNPADRTTIANAILASGCNTSLTAACATARRDLRGQGIGGPLSAADIAAINAGTYRFVIARNLLDVGIRDEKFQRDTYRVVGGAPRHVQRRLELRSLGQLRQVQGRHDDRTAIIDRQRFMLSLDAGRNPVTGQIQCRSQFDPAAAMPMAMPFAGQRRRNIGSPGRRHRGLRALQSVRRGRQHAPRPTISPTMRTQHA